MQATDKLYRTPSFVMFEQEEKNVKATNLITGKYYQLGQSHHQLIEFFKEPRSCSDFAIANGLNVGIVQKAADELVRIDLLYPEGEENSETAQLTPSRPGNRLFNLPTYNDRNDKSKILFIGCPFGKGNPQSDGSKEFPESVRVYANRNRLNLKDQLSQVNWNCLGNPDNYQNLLKQLSNSRISDAGDIFIHFNEGRKSVYNKLERLSFEFAAQGHIPFYLGGDHSISAPIIKGMAGYYDQLNVIQFDAHTDTYEGYFDKLLDNEGIHHHANFASQVLKESRVSKIYQLGIRGLANNRIHSTDRQVVYWEHELINDSNLTEKIDIPADIPLYVTFDIDFLSPLIAPGTATPVSGSFDLIKTKDLIRKTLSGKRIIGVDIVEVNPKKDTNDLTMQAALELILELLNVIS